MTYYTTPFRSASAGSVPGDPYWIVVDHAGKRVENMRSFKDKAECDAEVDRLNTESFDDADDPT